VETITLERRDAVAWVWLDQARRLNTINLVTLRELHQTFAALDADDGVRAIVLAARGPVFCAGFDVAWMAEQGVEGMAAGLEQAEAVYDTIEACRKPVIAAIQGAAMGGGLLLALVADLRLAAQEATFGAPEVRIGIFPNLRLIPRLERAVGLGAAKRMVLTGQPVDADQAQALGLVEAVLPAPALHAEAHSRATELANLPPAGLRAAKQAFHRAAPASEAFIAWERTEFAAVWASPQRQAAMRAFFERRSGPAEEPGANRQDARG
jgi:enoyl-CoA hydratase